MQDVCDERGVLSTQARKKQSVCRCCCHCARAQTRASVQETDLGGGAASRGGNIRDVWEECLKDAVGPDYWMVSGGRRA